MKRREFITLIGGAVSAWPVVARGQQSSGMKRIAMLLTLAESDTDSQARVTAFKRGLQESGWLEGRNIQIDVRWGGGDAELIRKYAAEIAVLAPDVVLAAATSVLTALQRELSSTPIVFVQVSDPVGSGLVKSLARPGGNITGFADYEFSVSAKWLELLKQIAPNITRVALLHDPANPSWRDYVHAIEMGGATVGVKVSDFAVRSDADIENAFAQFANESNGGLIPIPGPLIGAQRDLIISLATKYRLPNIYSLRYYPASGGLASSGVDNIDLYKRAAFYVDRILKGEKPGDLPVQQATKFELVINLKAAKELDLDVPLLLQQLADEVIE